MSYEYRIVPRESFKVRHNCSGCGMKSIFENTCCFRINANRKKIDVWLIYQCTKCRHPLNLTIYERKNSSEILNDYGLSIRDERIIADVFNCSRSYVKVMLHDKKIQINKKGNGMLIQINY